MSYKRIAHLVAGFVVVALAMTTSAVAQQREAEVALQQAMHAEQVEGDLERAIELYRDIVEQHGSARAVAAKALLKLGQCYEKLGRTEAMNAYETLVREYGDQSEAATEARTRLARLTQQLAEFRHQPTFTKIEIASNPQGGVLSPDGTKLAFVSDGIVWAVPLHGNVDPNIAGEPMRIADVPGGRSLGLAWSTDGEWIAVNGSQTENIVYVVPIGGGEHRKIPMPTRPGPWDFNLSLSPDGQRLAFTALEPEPSEENSWFNRQVYVVPIEGGEPQQMSSAWGGQADFSPDGEFIAYVGYRERNDLPEGFPLRELPWSGDLWVARSEGGTPAKLTSVDGLLLGPVWSPDGRYIAVLGPLTARGLVEVQVYPMSPDASSAGVPTPIALPRRSFSSLAGWTPDNELGVFMVSESHIAVYTVPASGGKAVQVTPDGVVYYPRWSPDGERIFLRWVSPSEGSRIAYVPAEGGDVIEVPWPEQTLMSVVPGGGHNVSPDGERVVVSGAVRPVEQGDGGDVWTIPVDGGRPTRLTSDQSSERYPCWSPDGQWVAFTDWHARSEEEGFKAIYMVPAEGGAIRQITSEADTVGDGAIAFSPDGERITFFSNGAIKTISIDGGQPALLVAEVRSGRHSQLEWSPDGLKIAHNAGGRIWITPIDGGVAEALHTGLPENAELGEFGWSPDGEKIVFMASTGGELEFWLIGDFLPEGR
jgi:Tol biopolymer transport system component